MLACKTEAYCFSPIFPVELSGVMGQGPLEVQIQSCSQKCSVRMHWLALSRWASWEMMNHWRNKCCWNLFAVTCSKHDQELPLLGIGNWGQRCEVAWWRPCDMPEGQSQNWDSGWSDFQSHAWSIRPHFFSFYLYYKVQSYKFIKNSMGSSIYS